MNFYCQKSKCTHKCTPDFLYCIRYKFSIIYDLNIIKLYSFSFWQVVHKLDLEKKHKSSATDQFFKQATFADLNERKTKYPANHPKQQAFDSAVIKYFALDGAHFDTVEKNGFQMLVEVLDRRITIKSRRRYMNALSDIVSKEIIPDRQKQLQSVDKRTCHFSCDIWSSRRGEGILCIMAHYIGKSWNLERKVILFESLLERHTGDHIRSVFLKCLADFKVDCDWVCYSI